MRRVPEPQRRSSPERRFLSALLQVVAAVAVLGAVGVVIWAKVLHTTKESPTAAISRITGRSVSCTDVGTRALTAGQAAVLLCTDTSGYHACWAHIGDAVVDVSSEMRFKYFGAGQPRC